MQFNSISGVLEIKLFKKKTKKKPPLCYMTGSRDSLDT